MQSSWQWLRSQPPGRSMLWLSRRTLPRPAAPCRARMDNPRVWLAYAFLALLGFVPAVAQAAAPTVQNQIPDQAAGAGTAFSYAFPANTFNDADGDTLTYTAVEDGETSLPTWLTFTATSRTFSGTPAVTDAETLTVKVTANDGNSGTVSDTFDILVGVTDVCLRTPAVRDAIVRKVSSASTCVAVTTANLAAIVGSMGIQFSNTTALRADDFDGLTALNVLLLSVNSLTTLPAGIFDNLTALDTLWLSRNSLTTLPAGVFDNLTALDGLYLDNNSLTTLPAGVFDNLTALEVLDLSVNSLTTLPAGIFDNLTALESLDLHNNSLPSLPAGVFDNLTALEVLDLHNNSLPSLPAGVFDNLTALTNLRLHNNSLTTLPAGVFDNLTALDVLWLSRNSLPSLPAGVFDNLTALRGLYLDDNSLTTLPAGVFDSLTALEALYLNNNSLPSLPADIFDNLTALTALRLQGNRTAPFKPTANAGADRSVSRSTAVTLSGTATGPWGDNVTWEWQQVTGASSNTEVTGTSAVTLMNATSATPSFTAPTTAQTLHFRLVATPVPGASTALGINASSADWVTITVTAVPGVVVSPETLTVTEGNTRTYTVQLGTNPGASVTVTPSSSDNGAATVSPAMTFTTANWNTAQTVTVTGVEDLDTANESVTVSHGVTGYPSVTTAPSVTVTVTDNDSSGNLGTPRLNTPTVEGTAGVVSWRAPLDDGGSPVLRYQYRVSTTSYPDNRDWIDLGEGVLRFERSSHSDVEYFYQVRAVNSDGPGPAASGSFRPFRQRAEALSALTPGAVRNLVATPGDRRVRLSWDAPTTVGEPQVTRYEYRYVRGDIIWLEESNPPWQSAGTGESATITELVNRKDYIFEVRAVNRNGAGNSVLVRTAPHVLVVAPPAVTGLRLEVEEISDIFGLNGGNRPRIVVRWNRPTAPWDTYPYLVQFQARIAAAGRAPSQWYDVGDAWVGNAWSDAAAITRFEDDGAFDRLEYGVQYTVEMRAVARAATFVSQNSGWEFIGTDIPGAIATPVHVTAEAPELPELEVFTEGTATEGQPLTVGLRRPDNTTDHPNHLGSAINAMVMIRDVNTLEVQETVWVKVASGAREGTTNRWTAPYDGQAADRQLEIRLVDWQPGRNYVNGTPAGLRVTLTNAEALQRVGPSVTAVAISPAPGGDAWDAGETVEAVLIFDEAVTVDTTNGTPHVQFELGTDTTRKDAGYASGSGTTALTFRHTVPTGQGPHRMALLAIDSLALNGGTIRSTTTGADADLAHRGAAYAGVITPNASAQSARSGPTAQFSALPESHDGANAFEAELTFSADPDGLSYVMVRDSLLEVTGGAVENAQRKVKGSDIGWVLTVRPSGRGSVTLTLPSRACGTEGAVCIGGEPLASDATATVPGPATVSTTRVSMTPVLPTISIAAPAQTPVTEGAALSFTLTRTGATDEALTVAVSVTETGDVLDGTPPASASFASGSSTAALSVPTLDDDAFEEASTVTVRVSDGSGYTVDGDAASASGLVESDDLAPITAQFTQAQDEHDGGAFELQFTFSHAPLLSYVTVRDALFDVTGGRIEYVRRLTWGSNTGWELRVKPDGFGDVTLSARATTDCEAAHGVCDAAGRRFDGALERTIQGPPTLSVADATVEEAEGATLDFTVTLSRSLAEAVTVTYATADGTATAGSDYRAANDTLTFTAGETAKTVSVAVLYNTHDEGSETLTLTLTSPSPSTVKLADADATGTITNTGPLPAAWTARFGRTVAEQVLDAVEGRMEAGRTAGLEVILAGEPITWQTEAAEGSLTPTGEDVFNDVVGRMGRRVHSGSLTSENVLTGSSFTLTRKNCKKNCENGGGHSDKGLLALWGHGAVSSFDGQEDEDDLSLTGDVSSAMVGADWGWERVLAGLVVGHSSGNGSYSATGGNGVISSSLTGLYPWARYELNEQLEVWGAAGYGAGSLTLTPDGEDAMDADLSLWMGAAGLRGLLIDGGAEGFTLAATTDALAVTTTTAAVAGEMAATDAGVTRLRLGLEGSLPVKLSDASLLTTSIEMGLRHDDGDAETGFGLEMGAGLAWHHQKRGLRAELRGRGLLTHAAEGFSNRGLSLSLAWDPTPASALGASFSLSQSMGGAATGGVDALLSPITMAGLTNTNGDGGREMENQRLELRLGYGLPAFSHAFSLTPELVVGLSETERDYSLLLALAPLGQEASMDVSLDLTRKQSTSSSSNGAGSIEHSLGLRFTSEF